MKLGDIDIGKIYLAEKESLLKTAEKLHVPVSDREDVVHDVVAQLVTLAGKNPEKKIDNLGAYLTTCVKNHASTLKEKRPESPFLQELKVGTENSIEHGLPVAAAPEEIVAIRDRADVLRASKLLSADEKHLIPAKEEIVNSHFDRIGIAHLELLHASRSKLDAFDQLLFEKLFVHEMSLTTVSKNIGKPIQEVRAAKDRIKTVLSEGLTGTAPEMSIQRSA